MAVVYPDLPAVKVYLGERALAQSDATLQEALAAEIAAQAAVCRVGDPYPNDMANALLRRVDVNLAMRALPLGVQSSDTGMVSLGSNDPVVRRLEKPYRKLVMG